MSELTTVTIPLEEYIELRRKADENLYLATQLGQFDQRLYEASERINIMERRLDRCITEEKI